MATNPANHVTHWLVEGPDQGEWSILVEDNRNDHDFIDSWDVSKDEAEAIQGQSTRWHGDISRFGDVYSAYMVTDNSLMRVPAPAVEDVARLLDTYNTDGFQWIATDDGQDRLFFRDSEYEWQWITPEIIVQYWDIIRPDNDGGRITDPVAAMVNGAVCNPPAHIWHQVEAHAIKDAYEGLPDGGFLIEAVQMVVEATLRYGFWDNRPEVEREER